MRLPRAALALALGATVVVTASAQRQAGKPASSGGPSVDVAAALAATTPDLDRRLARFKVVNMPFNAAGLNARERQMVDQLVVALRFLESMYWRQSDPDALALHKALAGNATPAARNLRRYL